MANHQSTFNAAAVGKKFKLTCQQFDNLLKQVNNEEASEIREKLHYELKQYQEQGILQVAFVGQYSAGKSTIISALTGQRDIKIDADIATDQTTSYNWNGIKVIDTPGLFTERKDHDQITYDAINKADLLIFCLTSMLFDSLTVENFKKLAYDKGYRWKMMLVINKMSEGAGDDEQLIGNYKESLSQALKPYNLNEFPICFIDAKDHCEGIDTEDEFLLEVSRFETLTNALNEFVDKRASLARFDTPVRIALGYVDEAQVGFTRSKPEDSTFFAVLNQLSRKVRNERNRLKTKVETIILKISSAVAHQGRNLASAVGTEEFETQHKQAQINVQRYYEEAGRELQSVIDAIIEDIHQEVVKVLEGTLFQNFVACLENKQSISEKYQNINAGLDLNRLKEQVSWIEKISETAGVKIQKAATGSYAKTASQQMLFRSMDVAGSTLHKSVYSIGKFVGFKFKPWQAVNAAKGIGNSAKFLGPAVAIASVGIDIYEMTEEQKREQKMADSRRDIISRFQAVSKDLETQIQAQVYEWENQNFGKIEKKIAEARKNQESAIASSNRSVRQLAQIRQEFESILTYINKSVNRG